MTLHTLTRQRQPHDPLPSLVQAIYDMNLRALDKCLEIAFTPYLNRKLRASTVKTVADRLLVGLRDVKGVL